MQDDFFVEEQNQFQQQQMQQPQLINEKPKKKIKINYKCIVLSIITIVVLITSIFLPWYLRKIDAEILQKGTGGSSSTVSSTHGTNEWDLHKTKISTNYDGKKVVNKEYNYDSNEMKKLKETTSAYTMIPILMVIAIIVIIVSMITSPLMSDFKLKKFAIILSALAVLFVLIVPIYFAIYMPIGTDKDFRNMKDTDGEIKLPTELDKYFFKEWADGQKIDSKNINPYIMKINQYVFKDNTTFDIADEVKPGYNGGFLSANTSSVKDSNANREYVVKTSWTPSLGWYLTILAFFTSLASFVFLVKPETKLVRKTEEWKVIGRRKKIDTTKVQSSSTMLGETAPDKVFSKEEQDRIYYEKTQQYQQQYPYQHQQQPYQKEFSPLKRKIPDSGVRSARDIFKTEEEIQQQQYYQQSMQPQMQVKEKKSWFSFKKKEQTPQFQQPMQQSQQFSQQQTQPYQQQQYPQQIQQPQQFKPQQSFQQPQMQTQQPQQFSPQDKKKKKEEFSEEFEEVQ